MKLKKSDQTLFNCKKETILSLINWEKLIADYKSRLSFSKSKELKAANYMSHTFKNQK